MFETILHTESPTWNACLLILCTCADGLRGRLRGCPCHPMECKAAAAKGYIYKFPNNNKGRTGPWLWEWVNEELSIWREAWQELLNDPGVRAKDSLYQSWHHAVGLLSASTKLKFAYADRSPWLIWRVRRDPSVARRWIDDYCKRRERFGLGDSHAQLHRLENKFLCPNGVLADGMEKLAESGTVTPELHSALLPYEQARLDGSRAEGIHRATHQSLMRAQRSNFAYWTTSNLIEQYMRTYHEETAQGNAARFHRFFTHYKSILQANARLVARLVPKRITDAALDAKIFRMFPYSTDDVSELVGKPRMSHSQRPRKPKEPHFDLV